MRFEVHVHRSEFGFGVPGSGFGVPGSTHDAVAAEAFRELVGLIDYLQSPEAEENARRLKAKRIEKRKHRQSARNA